MHRHGGITLKTKYATGWNGSIVIELPHRQRYRAPCQPAEDQASGGAGSWTRRDGTAEHLEVQAAYRPSEGDFTDGRHALTLGAHRTPICWTV